MKRITFLQILLLMVISFSLPSCSSTEISKLEGDWQLFWINNITDNNIYIWSFEGGELAITQYDPDSPTGAVVGARAQYTTSAEFLDAVVEISGYVPSVSSAEANTMISNGVWTIDKIDDEVLRLGTEDQGGYVIREFTRVQ